MQQIIAETKGRWLAILAEYGLSDFTAKKHGPCPMCGGRDRYRYIGGDKGNWFCNQCGTGDGFDLLVRKTGKTLKQLIRDLKRKDWPKIEIKEKPAAGIEKELNRVWCNAVSVKSGTEAFVYLQRRGLKEIPGSLRFNRACYESETKKELPAMVALVVDQDGKPVNVHRTYLQGGKKAEIESPKKLMPGLKCESFAIRLYPAGEVLGVAEGIETAIACRNLFGVPVWAAVNAGMMEKFVPPAEVKKVIVYGDNDANFTGQKAAFILAHRLANKFEVEVAIPELQGDWLDFLNYRQEAGNGV